MRFGVASISVTGTDLPSSVKNRLMPALRPTMPSEYFFAVMWLASGQLDLDVDACRELELHERVHGLVVGVDDVEHALVRAGLVLVARVLVDVRRGENGVALDLGRQRDRATHLRAGPLGRFDDLAGRAVDQTMIVRLQPNPDLLVRHDGVPWLKERRADDWLRRTPVEFIPALTRRRPSKITAGRFPGPPRRNLRTHEAAIGRKPGQAAPCDISLSGEDEVLPAPHFAGSRACMFMRPTVVAHSNGFPEHSASTCLKTTAAKRTWRRMEHSTRALARIGIT